MRSFRPRGSHRWRFAPALLATLALLLTACTDADPASSASPSAGRQPSASATSGAAAPAKPSVQPTPKASGSKTSTSSGSTARAWTPPPGCQTRRWGTGPKEPLGKHKNAMAQAPITTLRVGRHPCFDRVVFDIGSAEVTSYHVAYVKGDVRADGSGRRVPVDGQRALEVVIRSDGRQAVVVLDKNHQKKPPRSSGWRDRDQLYGVVGPGIRGLVDAGHFEGQSTYALGTPGLRPVRVIGFPSEIDGHWMVVVDVAR
jgi:hypothetical protein